MIINPRMFILRTENRVKETSLKHKIEGIGAVKQKK